MSPLQTGLLDEISNRFAQKKEVCAVLVFGSSARKRGANDLDSSATRSDLDLHVVTTFPCRLESIDWSELLPDQRFFSKRFDLPPAGPAR